MKCENCSEPGALACEIGGQSLSLCDRCRLRFELQSEFERRVPAVLDSVSAGNYAGALEILGAAEAELGHRDLDGWLGRSLLACKAMVLEEQGNWPGALKLIEQRLLLPFTDSSEHAVSLLSGALALLRLGRVDEARAHMSSALDCLESAHPQATLPKALRWLEEGDETIFLGRGELIAAALQAFNLVAPVDPRTDPVGALRWAQLNWPAHPRR